MRWDGGHRRSRFLNDTLDPFVDWWLVCPEVEAGLGTPRETVRLTAEADGLRLVGARSGTDQTARVTAAVERAVDRAVAADLDGFVVKRDSPTCGMERVRVWSAKGMPERRGRGLFTEALMQRMPLLPVEEEGRLQDAVLRENFVARLFAHRKLRHLFASDWSVGDLVAFHSVHKLQLMAHSPIAYRTLGRIVAHAKTTPREELVAEYSRIFMDALARPISRGRHVNVLQHCVGYLRGPVAPKARRAVSQSVEDYAAEIAPLVAPMSLLRHYVDTLDIDYLAAQSYFTPHPKELALLRPL